MVIDLHIHSIFSDGCLLPSEIARRYEAKGFDAIAITDHADYSNLRQNISAILEFCSRWNKSSDANIKVIPGVELTHCPPDDIPMLIKTARELGARLVVVHGESIVEPVAQGTNRAAILGGADILAHPGFITDEDARLAKDKGTFLEISTRKGHSYTNGFVLKKGIENGCRFVINNDAHCPSDFLPFDIMKNVFLGSGGSEKILQKAIADGQELVKRLLA